MNKSIEVTTETMSSTTISDLHDRKGHTRLSKVLTLIDLPIEIAYQIYHYLSVKELASLHYVFDSSIHYIEDYKLTHMVIIQCVSDLFFENNKRIYRCVNLQKEEWYHFENHRWKLCHFISQELLGMIEHFLEEIMKCRSPVKREFCQKIIHKLQLTSFRKKVLDASAKRFHDYKFKSKLDTNLDLIGFENGVYDLATSQNSIFRDGQPEDYISISTGIDYQEFDMDDKRVLEVMKFFEEIQPDKKVRNYLLTCLASCLSGRQDETFYIWLRLTGSNGTTTLEKLIQKTFGNYCQLLPESILTGATIRRAYIDLGYLHGTRVALFGEPDNKISLGRIKELICGDLIYSESRRFHQIPFKFRAQFKLFLSTCQMPDLPDDAGLWRRIRIIPFGTQFVDEPIEEHQMMIDRQLEQKIEEWAKPFMFILIKQYQIYREKGLVTPQKIKTLTKKYQHMNDPSVIIDEFVNEIIEKTDSESDQLYGDEIYFRFKVWYKEAYQYRKRIRKKEFLNYLSQKFGSVVSGAWERSESACEPKVSAWTCMRFYDSSTSS